MRGEQEATVAAAVAALARGELVGLPTETVYGLGANAADPAAIARLYAAKGRPADHPVIVHIASPAALLRWVREVPPAAQALAAACWPGPLTLVLPRATGVLDADGQASPMGGDTQGRHFLRLHVSDRPGVLARITGILGEHGISIASVIQHDADADSADASVPLVIMTHRSASTAIRAAVEAIDRCDAVRGPSVCLGVLDD